MRSQFTTEPCVFMLPPLRAVVVLSFALGTAAITTPTLAAGGRGTSDFESLRIEILPGEREKLIDPVLGGRVPVAVLGTAAMDVREVDSGSLVFAGAAVVKNDDGSLAAYRDVNGDGRTDMIVSFAARQIHLGDRSAHAVLSGRTTRGRVVSGSGAVATVESARFAWRLAARVDRNDEKLPPMPVSIDVMPREPVNRIELGNRGTVAVAVLSAPGFDATRLDPRTLYLAGARVTRRERGGMASLEDVDGDGLADLVVEVPKALLKLGRGSMQALLTGLTPEGRLIRGADAVSIADTGRMTFDSEDPAPRQQPQPDSESFANTTSIAINDNTTATPYPSNIVVSGLTGVVSKVRVTLRSLAHTFANDIDILLVGPSGQNLILMADVGGGAPGVSSIDVTFDDDASAPLDPVNNPSSGVYRPANLTAGDTFPAPAPAPTAATTLSVFNGTNPNGTWSLYVLDDRGGDSGSIGRGWQLDFVMASEFCSAGFITIPEVEVGAGAPYPATVSVAGLTGVVAKVTAVFKQFRHDFPDDIDALLESPNGLTSMLMSDTGGRNLANLVDLVIDANAALTFDPSVSPVTGTYQQSDNEPGDSLPLPAPGGSTGTLDVFQGSDPNGTWNLWIADDLEGGDGFLVAFCLNITVLTPVDGVDPTMVTIPSGAPGVTTGPAAPYPARIDVTGALGTLWKTTVTLRGLTHTHPQDLDVLLAAPTGRNVMLMSDVDGVGPGVAGVTYTFDDDASSAIPTFTNMPTGSYKPTNDDTSGPDVMPGPAPTGPYGATLSGLSSGGAGPNGPWYLYVFDDAAGDVGSIASGWSISVRTILPNAGGCSFPFFGINIPAGAPAVTSGPSDVYPAGAVVVGYPVDLTQYKVKVTLRGLRHTFPNDIDVLLVGPTGQKVMIMSDVGGVAPGVSGVDLAIFDDAPNSLTDTASPASGSYKPADFFPGDTMPAPAPAGPYASSLSAFEGTRALGSWALYVADDTSGDSGQIGGWCLDFISSINVGQVPNLRFADKSRMVWDAGANAYSYNVYRGDQSALSSLANQNIDSCLRGTTLTQQFKSVTEVPASGTFLWYLVLGNNAQGEGPAGFERLAGQGLARLLNSSGNCP